MSELKNDEEFGALVFPISDNEYDALEENIFDHGCGEPIIVWDNIIIDGRKRYDICKKWELPFPVKRIDFENRYEAAAWICRNQLERGDLPDAMRKYLIGRYYKSSGSLQVTFEQSPRLLILQAFRGLCTDYLTIIFTL